jgi:hypothetical protein
MRIVDDIWLHHMYMTNVWFFFGVKSLTNIDNY